MIVATSTLELGIDVGDLDRVIQIDAPTTVAAFLQRLGRTGRRPGTTRNCLFLATKSVALLQAAGSTRGDLLEPLQGLLAASDTDAGSADAILDHMEIQGYIQSDAGVLGLGPAAERRYGQKHFMALFSVFDSPELVSVMHGREELGQVHPLTFRRKDPSQPIAVSLAGRAWRVRSVDWARRVAWVEPTQEPGKSLWSGETRPLSHPLCQSMLAVLQGEAIGVRLSSRAQEAIAALPLALPVPDPGSTLLVLGETGTEWWTFAGGLANACLVAELREEGFVARSDSLKVTADDRAGALLTASAPLIIRRAMENPRPATQAGVKFEDCLPNRLRDQLARRRSTDTMALQALGATRCLSTRRA